VPWHKADTAIALTMAGLIHRSGGEIILPRLPPGE
jgi:hypothetical protein